jgi:hypothetical protein
MDEQAHPVLLGVENRLDGGADLGPATLVRWRCPESGLPGALRKWIFETSPASRMIEQPEVWKLNLGGITQHLGIPI